MEIIPKNPWLSAWLNNPRRTGACTSASIELANAISSAALCSKRTDRIIDIGAGSGKIAEALISNSFPPKSICLIEPNKAFHGLLNNNFPHSKIVHGTLQETRSSLKSSQPTTIISSVPLYSLPNHERDSFLDAIQELIRENHILRCIQYTYAPFLPWKKARAIFGNSPKLIIRNIPPAWIWSHDIFH
jgi:phospholipid N-methyltransferase